jgi:hypothetical protein
MISFLGASSVLLGFFFAKKLYHRRTFEAHPFYALFTLLQEAPYNRGKKARQGFFAAGIILRTA